MMLTGEPSDKLAIAIANARRIIAEKAIRNAPKEPTLGESKVAEQQALVESVGQFVWNAEQSEAIRRVRSGESICLIGSAGTGKTTTLKGAVSVLLKSGQLPPLEKGTKHLPKGAPGIVLFSYTRRAVRNIAKQMPDELKGHCITGHKLLEFKPERFEVDDGKGGYKTTMRFVPSRHRGNPLPSNLRLIIVDESSMVSADFFQLVLDALPNKSNVQWLFLGDLHQLPPVYGDAILGHKLLELPIVELTQVYRQALESPIIELALAIKDNKILPELKALTKNWVKETPRGKVTLNPWKKKLDQEEGLFAMQKFLRDWVQTDRRPNQPEEEKINDSLNFEEDVILCPWNKSFGNVELNKAIGTQLALKFDRDVFEIIAGYEKIYYSVGDRILYDKRDAIITRIVRNTRYVGRHPQYHSKGMDYWGYTRTPTIAVERSEEIENDLDMMGEMSDVEDRVTEASHAVYCRFADGDLEDEETILSKAGDLNATELAYCMSVHKSQGSEWKRVILITHSCHSKMASRELIYTAFTRASQELYVFMEPMFLTKAGNSPRIKGDTLEKKLDWFKMRAKEREAAQKKLMFKGAERQQMEDDEE